MRRQPTATRIITIVGVALLAAVFFGNATPMQTSGPTAHATGYVTVDFHKNASQHQGGAVTGDAPGDITGAANSPIILPGKGNLARAGFTFDGWNTEEDGTGDLYEEGDEFTPTGNTSLYAMWGIPEAARLFRLGGEEKLTTTGNVRGITTDGTHVFYVSSLAEGNRIRRLTTNGDDAGFFTVTTSLGDPFSLATLFANIRDGVRDLAYSSGHIWVREDGTAGSKLYAISVPENNNDGGVLVEVALPVGFPFFQGQAWLQGNIVDFPDGRIGAVSRNKQGLDSTSDADGNPLVCPPNGFQCKVLRLYDVSYNANTPETPPTLTHSEDILLADDDTRTRSGSGNCWTGFSDPPFFAGWPCDDHGIATDGTYLYQSHFARGYKVWALQSNGPSYVVFNGDGINLAKDVIAEPCGAVEGISGGICDISGFFQLGLSGQFRMLNSTYFTRDHVNERYMMGDFGANTILLTQSRRPPAGGPGAVSAPTVPLSVAATAGDESAVVTWNAPAQGAPILSYTVTASPGGETCTTTSTTCTFENLTNGTAYTFTVVARNGGGGSPGGASNSVTPGGSPSPGPVSQGGSTPSNATPAPRERPAVNAPEPQTPATTTTRFIPPSRVAPAAPGTPPVPQPVARPGAGFNPDAPSRATVGGAPVNVIATADSADRLSVNAGAFRFGVGVNAAGGGQVQVNTPSNSPELFVPRGQGATVTGGGSFPGSFVQLWLPGDGTDAREVARIPVRPDGTFASDIAFGPGNMDMPVPIGRQVLQVVGYDEAGNQTVVDMTINIGQGVPAPEPNRQVGELPALSFGQALATSGGLPETVSITGVPETGSVNVEGSGWFISVNADENNGFVENASGNVLLRLNQSAVATAEGTGFLPGTLATVWLFSDPTLVDTVSVNEDGSFTSEFLVDGRLIAPGEHTLQVQGVGFDGYIKAANLGVLVEQAAVNTSESASGLLFWMLGLLLVAIMLVFIILARRRRRQDA